MVMTENNRILLIEDDESLSLWVSDYLGQHDYQVTIEHRGDQAIDQIRAVQPALIVLDVMLPGKSGFDICREIRPDSDIPILMLTARDDEIDQVVGLELGADDYVLKPVKPRVLLARIQALLRRVSTSMLHSDRSSAILRFEQLTVNSSSRSVMYDDASIALSDAEFDLLWLLVNSPGEPLSRDDILRDLRGIDYDGLDRSVDARVSQAADAHRAWRQNKNSTRQRLYVCC